MVDNWDEYGEEDWGDDACMEDFSQPTANIDTSNVETCKVLDASEIRPALIAKINDWNGLYDLGFDDMVKVARKFMWSDDNMQAWFE